MGNWALAKVGGGEEDGGVGPSALSFAAIESKLMMRTHHSLCEVL